MENLAEQGGERRNTVVFREQLRSYAGFYAAVVKWLYWKILLHTKTRQKALRLSAAFFGVLTNKFICTVT